MPTLHIPDEGLTVPAPSLQVPEAKSANPKASYPAPFAIKINLTERFLEELSTGKVPVFMNTGKRMSLQAGSNQFEFMPTAEMFDTEIFQGSGEDLISLGFSKDKLELLEIVENRVDEAALALKREFEALQQKKEKKSVQLVSNPSNLGPELSGRRGLIAAKKAGIQTPQAMKTKINRRTKFGASVPNSPALNAASPGVTSAPSKPRPFRKEALFVPLIHLLAMAPEKDQVLAMKTHTPLDKCSDMLIKVANRHMSGRWELQDAIFKEIDVWNFPYPKQEMRDMAIENAEKAFDKLKLADDAPEWEMLRKPEDRGKPREPRRKPAPVVELEPPKKKPTGAASPAVLPSIAVSKAESASNSPAILAAEPMSRSISQTNGPVPKARGGAEAKALKKILGTTKGAKAKAAATPKSTGTTSAAPKEKKTPLPSTTSTSNTPSIAPTSFAAKSTPTLPASRSPAVTTSLAPKPKPVGRKPLKDFKSPEVIEDSDSDGDAMEIDTPPQKPTPSSVSSQPVYARPSQSHTPLADSRSPNIASKRPVSVSVVGKQEPAAPSPAQNGHKRTTSMSASSSKPSPLGSSPPLTASDIVRQSSTASSSPLSSVATPDLNTPIIHSYTSVPISTPKSSTERSTAAAKPRYVPESRDSASPQIKRKADESVVDRPRKRVMSSSSEDHESDGGRRSLRDNESERVTTARKMPKSSAPAPSQAKKAPIKTVVTNGVSKKDFEEVRSQRKDLPRASYASSTTSTASSVSRSSSDGSSRLGRRYRPSDENLELLSKYRRMHRTYQSRYERVATDPDIPREEFQKLLQLHNQLAEMKIKIQTVVAF